MSNYDAAGSWIGGKQQGGLWWKLEGFWRGITWVIILKGENQINFFLWHNTAVQFWSIVSTNRSARQQTLCKGARLSDSASVQNSTYFINTKSPSILECKIPLPYGTVLLHNFSNIIQYVQGVYPYKMYFCTTLPAAAVLGAWRRCCICHLAISQTSSVNFWISKIFSKIFLTIFFLIPKFILKYCDKD